MKLVGSTQSIVGIVMLTGFYAAKESGYFTSGSVFEQQHCIVCRCSSATIAIAITACQACGRQPRYQMHCYDALQM